MMKPTERHPDDAKQRSLRPRQDGRVAEQTLIFTIDQTSVNASTAKVVFKGDQKVGENQSEYSLIDLEWLRFQNSS